MSYRKYPLFFLLTLSFVQSAQATLRDKDKFREESCQSFPTSKKDPAPKANKLKAFDFKKYFLT